MNIEQFAYWFIWTVPLWLIMVSIFTKLLVDSDGWNRKHSFISLDLTLFFLAACLINLADVAKDLANEIAKSQHISMGTPEFADIARAQVSDTAKLLFTGGLIGMAVVIMLFQIYWHRTWKPDAMKDKGQKWRLCYASNAISVIMLYGFIRLKTEGYL